MPHAQPLPPGGPHGAGPLWRSIRFLQHRYSQAFNRRCQVFGPLWQSRYKARPVQEQGSLLRLLAYVHLNPVVGGMAEDPGRYRWSGHRELLGRSRRPLLDRDLVFSLLGGTRRAALRACVSMPRREREEPWIGGRLEGLPWWKGEPSEAGSRGGLDALGRSSALMRPRLSAEEFLVRVSGLLGVEINELASRQRGKGVVEARELVGGLGVERWGIGVKALADALGKSRDGVSHWVRRAANRRSEDATFAKRLEDLDCQLATSLGQ